MLVGGATSHVGNSAGAAIGRQRRAARADSTIAVDKVADASFPFDPGSNTAACRHSSPSQHKAQAEDFIREVACIGDSTVTLLGTAPFGDLDALFPGGDQLVEVSRILRGRLYERSGQVSVEASSKCVAPHVV